VSFIFAAIAQLMGRKDYGRWSRAEGEEGAEDEEGDPHGFAMSSSNRVVSPCDVSRGTLKRKRVVGTCRSTVSSSRRPAANIVAARCISGLRTCDARLSNDVIRI